MRQPPASVVAAQQKTPYCHCGQPTVIGYINADAEFFSGWEVRCKKLAGLMGLVRDEGKHVALHFWDDGRPV